MEAHTGVDGLAVASRPTHSPIPAAYEPPGHPGALRPGPHGLSASRDPARRSTRSARLTCYALHAPDVAPNDCYLKSISQKCW